MGDSGMTPGTDLIQIDGANQVVYDKVSSGYQYPTTDGTGHLTATFTDVGNNWLEVSIKRPLDTGDSQDFVLPTGTYFKLGWAIRYSSATLSLKHNISGSLNAYLSSSESTGVSSDLIDDIIPANPVEAARSIACSSLALVATILSLLSF